MAENPHRRLGIAMTIGMWILVLGLLTLLFQNWGERQYNPNQSPAQSMRSNAAGNGVLELVLERNRWGHYVATGSINGESVVFMLDTGASDISVPDAVANRLGLRRGPVMNYQTANGAINVYATTLNEVALGDIALSNVRASINPHMDGEEVLLGMSFLKHLEFTQQGNTLTLRQNLAGQ